MLKQCNDNDPCNNLTSQEWTDYFKELFNTDHSNNFSSSDIECKYVDSNFEVLNKDITAGEITLALKSLKKIHLVGLMKSQTKC